MNSPIISCIVCAYNAEKTIARTLGSLMDTSLSDFVEIIFINDGSTDSTLNLARDFEGHKNIKIINKLNEGLGKSRNSALTNATGEFVAFCDADDIFFVKNYVELTKTAIKHNYDIIISKSYALVNGSKIEDFWDSHIINLIKNSNNTISEVMKFLLQPSACNKIFKKDFILRNNIRFTEGKLFEDVEFTSKSLMMTSRIMFSDLPVFLYDFHGSGSITSDRSLRRYDILNNVRLVCDLMNKSNLNALQSLALTVSLMRTTLWCLDNLPASYHYDFEEKIKILFMKINNKSTLSDFSIMEGCLTDEWDRRALHRLHNVWKLDYKV